MTQIPIQFVVFYSRTNCNEHASLLTRYIPKCVSVHIDMEGVGFELLIILQMSIVLGVYCLPRSYNVLEPSVFILPT